MKIVLKQAVENLGEAGDVVVVKDGYGRNYLIPQGFAVVATPGAIKAAAERAKHATKRISENVAAARELAAQLGALKIEIAMKAGDDGKLFGSVTNGYVADALKNLGFEIDRRKIVVEEIKHLGEHTATVNLLGEVKASLTISVVKE